MNVLSLSGITIARSFIMAQWGEEIAHAADRAIATAEVWQKPVFFDFNGYRVIVTAGETGEAVRAAYLAELDRSKREWDASPEGIAEAERDRIRLQERQHDLDALIASLPAILPRGLPDVVAWVAVFVPAADWVGLEYDAPALAVQLATLAPAGVHVGRQELAEYPNELGEWILGQLVDALANNRCPARMIGQFAQDWPGLPATLEKRKERA